MIKKMGFKTITVSEEAYKRLKERKQKSESFSDVIMRITTKNSLRDFVGILSEESNNKIEKSLEKFRKSRAKLFENKFTTLSE